MAQGRFPWGCFAIDGDWNQQLHCCQAHVGLSLWICTFLSRLQTLGTPSLQTTVKLSDYERVALEGHGITGESEEPCLAEVGSLRVSLIWLIGPSGCVSLLASSAS